MKRSISATRDKVIANLKQPIVGVPLGLIGGLYTEALPSDLPAGASPLSINNDYIIGSNLPRPGKRSFFTFADFFVQRDAGFGQSVPDGPNETPWTTPNNISVHTPPAYATVTLNGHAGGGIVPGPFDSFIGLSSPSSAFGPGSGTLVTLPFFANAVGDYVVVGTQWAGTFSVPGISDNAGMTWVPIVAVAGFAVWMARATSAAVSGCTISITVGAAGSDATTYAYCILNNVLGLRSVLTAANQNFSAHATVNIGGLSNSTMAIKATNVGFTEGTACFIGDIGSVMLNFVGSDTGTLQDPGGNVTWNAINGSGAPGQLIQVWRYGGTVLPFPSFAAAPSFDAGIASGYPVTGGSAVFDVGPLAPSDPNEFALFAVTPSIATINSGWSNIFSNLYIKSIGLNPTVEAVGTLSAPQLWAGLLGIFKTDGGTPTVANANTASQATPGFPGAIATVIMPNPTTAGNTMIATITLLGQVIKVPPTITDSQGNTWVCVQSQFIENQTGTVRAICMYIAQNIVGGALTVTAQAVGGFASSGEVDVVEFTPFGQGGFDTTDTSEVLEGLNYGFTIPATTKVIGFQVIVGGNQTSEAPDAILTLRPLNPTADSPVYTFQLPAADGEQTFGQPSDNWGFDLSPDLLNDPSFGMAVKATALDGTEVTLNVYRIAIKAFLTPDPPPDFNYLKTFAETAGEITNLALGSDGTMYGEDKINNPGVLTGLYTAIEPDSFAESCTQNDREFIAISNLLNGTDIPYAYNGTNFDRLSQVGPGAPPSATATTSGSPIVSITQNPAVPLLTGTHDWLLVSDSPSDHGNFGTPATPGNVFTIIFRSATTVPTYITVGSNLVIGGFPNINGNVVNNDPTGVAAPPFYTVIAVGKAIPGQQSYDAISFIVPFTTFYNQPTPAGCHIQSTLSTMTTSIQVPNLEVGGQFRVAGTGGGPPAGYDSTWVVTATPNASQFDVTSTKLLNNVATYNFTLVSGTAPVVGQAVNVIQTLNGNGIFNVSSAIITSAGVGTFSINLVGPDVSSAAETGSGIIFGTIFQFDAFTIIPNVATGTVVASGQIAAGVRKVCYSFLTRSGYITKPSPIFTFTVPEGVSKIAIANLLTGPPNVIARIIHLTAANGSNFYNLPEPVPPVPNTIGDVGSDSTYVRDNVTTNVQLNFADATLLGGIQIDTEGNNLFATNELGSSVGFIPYAARIFAIGEQNKINNWLNWSFDGGTIVTQSSAGAGGGAGVNSTSPAGWTVDPTNGDGGAVVASPIFGTAYQIANDSGSDQTFWGMITQPMFEDEFKVPIIQASTTYSVRVTASFSGDPGSSSNLVVELFSPSVNRFLGAALIPFTSMTATMQIFTGSLLPTALAPVPNDLVIRVYATNFKAGAIVTIDRIEPFPTENPVLSTQILGSYVNNFEAFDVNTGKVDASIQNQQPIKSAFTLFESLYAVKSSSLVETEDNGTTEPVGWRTRTISNSVGTLSIYGVTTGIDEPNVGEEWAVITGRAGAFIFTGGEPVKLSEEIQSLWNQINFRYAHTMVVKNDIINRRIMILAPVKVPNTWIPAGIIPADSNPTTPNVMLMLNYRQLTTASELADRPQVHTSGFAGKTLALDMTRKWSVWTIKAPCMAFLEQGDNTAPLFLGNSDGTGKIYELVDGLLEDDGVAFQQIYGTFGWITSDQEGQFQMQPGMKTAQFMRLNVDGTGEFTVNIAPNSPNGPYAHDLLPNLTLPASTNGDVELPVDEPGADRFFLTFSTNAVGAGFKLSRVVLGMRNVAAGAVRGINN